MSATADRRRKLGHDHHELSGGDHSVSHRRAVACGEGHVLHEFLRWAAWASRGQAPLCPTAHAQSQHSINSLPHSPLLFGLFTIWPTSRSRGPFSSLHSLPPFRSFVQATSLLRATDNISFRTWWKTRLRSLRKVSRSWSAAVGFHVPSAWPATVLPRCGANGGLSRVCVAWCVYFSLGSVGANPCFVVPQRISRPRSLHSSITLQHIML